MSTLKVAAINNPSAGSGGLAISTTGNVSGTGADLIAVQSFAAATSVSVDNCFTSAYDNYRILWVATASASLHHTRMRYRAGGVDTTTGYRYGSVYTGSDNSSNLAGASQGDTYMYVGYNGAIGDPALFDISVIGPNRAASTLSYGFRMYRDTSDNLITSWQGHSAYGTAQFDGFTVYTVSGTFTGTVRVYGYRN